MSFIYPILAAILQASSFTIDKITLGIKRVTYKNYTAISFPLILIFNLIIFLIFKPNIAKESFAGFFFLLLILSIILSLLTNIIFYKALKSDKLSEMQTISLLNRIPLIIFAGLIFPDERNPLFIALAIFAALSLIWSHWERHHFHIAKQTWPFLLWTLTIAPFSAIIYKKLLEIWNPISLQLIINGVLAIFFITLFHKNIKTTPKQALPYLLITNLLTTIAWILYFFSFKISGIIFTVLVFSLQPFLVYLASLFILKEKHNWKKTLSFLIILTAIALSKVFDYRRL